MTTKTIANHEVEVERVKASAGPYAYEFELSVDGEVVKTATELEDGGATPPENGGESWTAQLFDHARQTLMSHWQVFYKPPAPYKGPSLVAVFESEPAARRFIDAWEDAGEGYRAYDLQKFDGPIYD